jgi:hypothetical protein
MELSHQSPYIFLHFARTVFGLYLHLTFSQKTLVHFFPKTIRAVRNILVVSKQELFLLVGTGTVPVPHLSDVHFLEFFVPMFENTILASKNCSFW